MSSQQPNQRFFSVGPLIIKLEASLPIKDNMVNAAIQTFEIPHSEDWDITLHLHFGIPKVIQNPGQLLGIEKTWAFFEKPSGEMTFIDISPDRSFHFLPNTDFLREEIGGSKIYEIQSTPQLGEKKTLCNLIYHPETNAFELYIPDDKWQLFEKGGNLFDPTLLQIMLTQSLYRKNGLLIHAAGLSIDDHGMVFVGHSGAGKSTISSLILDHKSHKTQMLCDDRVVIWAKEDHWYVGGTWCHGSLPAVSGRTMPLRAIYIINQAKEDRIVPMDNPLKRFMTLFGFTVRSWQKKNQSAPTMDILQRVCEEIPMANIYFTKSKTIVKKLLQQHFPKSDD